MIAAILLSLAIAQAGASIEGSWTFERISYRGQIQPKPNPDLSLVFSFGMAGVSRLYWTRKGSDAFCERLGDYELQGRTLIDRITWVNPGNARECASDPDMRLGRETQTEFEVNEDGELWLWLPLGDEWLIYIFERVGEH